MQKSHSRKTGHQQIILAEKKPGAVGKVPKPMFKVYTTWQLEGFYTEVFSTVDFYKGFFLLEAFSVYLTITTIYFLFKK